MKESGKPELAFDLEGTLVDLEKFHQAAFQRVAEQLGLSFGKSEFLTMVGKGDAAIAKEIARLGELKTYKLIPEQIRKAKNEVYNDMLSSHRIEARPGAAEYLERSSTLVGGKLVIASLTNYKMAQRILEDSHLKPFFKFILTERSVTRVKPDPEVYLKAAGLLGV